MSWLSGLGKALGVAGSVIGAPFTGGASLGALPTILSAGGKAAGALAQGQAANRGTQYEGQLDLERLLMDRDRQYQDQQIQREQAGRTSETDTLRKLLSAQHVGNPAAMTQLSPYSVAPRQATDVERSTADDLTQQLMARLQAGNPIAPVSQRPLSVDPRLLKPGTGESLSGWLGALLPGAGAVLGGMRPKPGIYSGIPSGTPRA